MFKIKVVIAILIVTYANITFASSEIELKSRCTDIINYKLVNDIDALLGYYHPKSKRDADSLASFKRHQTKRYKRLKRKGDVVSVTFSNFEDVVLRESLKKKPFTFKEIVDVVFDIHFTSQKEPSQYFCEFGLDADTNKWFLINMV